jgi:Mitochondrial carrier protein
VAWVQLQGLASGVGTFLGTCIRIPCEVLKQRLQVGRYDNVVEAAMKATELEGVRGLFRGTTATLAREVPFYVFGMVGYEQLKKIANGTLQQICHLCRPRRLCRPPVSAPLTAYMCQALKENAQEICKATKNLYRSDSELAKP